MVGMCFKYKVIEYSQEEREEVIKYFVETFGNVNRLLKEGKTKRLVRELMISYPTDKRPYYVISTLGMGAQSMKNVPEKERNHGIGRCELLMYLPKDWNLKVRDYDNYWPISWLRGLMTYPTVQKTWLSYGHTIRVGNEFPNTKFDSFLFDFPHFTKHNTFKVKLKTNKEIFFYQVVPLYNDELMYKLENSYTDLKALLKEDAGIINPKRNSVLKI